MVIELIGDKSDIEFKCENYEVKDGFHIFNKVSYHNNKIAYDHIKINNSMIKSLHVQLEKI